MVQAKELPKEVIDRIVIRNAILDSLPDHALEKADFILEFFQMMIRCETGVITEKLYVHTSTSPETTCGECRKNWRQFARRLKMKTR